MFVLTLTPWNWALLEKMNSRTATQEFPQILWNPDCFMSHNIHSQGTVTREENYITRTKNTLEE
jgi:hypothetical protein